MDSILVVTYSYSGVSRRVAQLLCSHYGWQFGEIFDSRRRAGVRGTLRSVFDSLLRRRPAIRYDGPDPADFRTVVLVSPIWMYRLAGPMRSFVMEHRKHLKRVAVISTMGSKGASNAVAEIARLLGRTPVLSSAVTQREVEDGECTSRLLGFGEALQPRSKRTQAKHDAAWAPHTA